MTFPIVYFVFLGAFVSWLTIRLLLKAGVGQRFSTSGQCHHTHEGSIPRIGGLGLVSGFTVTYVLCFFRFDPIDNESLIHYAVFSGGVAAFMLGLFDDFKPLGAKLKLLAQIVIALIAYQCGLSIERFAIPFTETIVEIRWVGMVVTVFWFVAMMNLINLIDGLDGLAGGIGLMLMGLLAFLGIQGNVLISTVLALGMVGALVGFLFHNFPPAKVYMGDSGAYLIGFVIAALSLVNSQKGAVLAALIAPILALALPIADVSFALLRRGIKGLPLFRPDRSHIHHRLIQSGLSRRNTVILLYGVSLFALIGGLLTFASQGRFLAIFLGFAFVIILITLRGNKISPQSMQEVLTDSIRARQDTRNALYLKDWFVVEVERADRGQHLWSDFHFVLKKMGFCRAKLSIGKESRQFYVPNTPHDQPELLQYIVIPIRSETSASLELYADKDHFSERQFTLVAEIAAEAWTKAASRWMELNECALTFSAEARQPNSYRGQKMRNLYRPTY